MEFYATRDAKKQTQASASEPEDGSFTVDISSLDDEFDDAFGSRLEAGAED
jgi:hypothetical protein